MPTPPGWKTIELSNLLPASDIATLRKKLKAGTLTRKDIRAVCDKNKAQLEKKGVVSDFLYYQLEFMLKPKE